MLIILLVLFLFFIQTLIVYGLGLLIIWALGINFTFTFFQAFIIGMVLSVVSKLFFPNESNK